MIYFIQRKFMGLVKIGYTRQFPIRFRTLQGEHRTERLTILAAIPGNGDAEDALHARFSSDRFPGEFEWFYPTQRVLDAAREFGVSSDCISSYEERPAAGIKAMRDRGGSHGPKMKLSPAKQAALVRMRKSGATAAEVARKFNVSVGSVRNYVQRAKRRKR